MKLVNIEFHQEYIDQFHKKYISVIDASKKYKMTPQAFYTALNEKKISSMDAFGKKWLLKKDVDAYSRHSHEHMTDDTGKRIFRNGYISIKKMSEILGCSTNKIYYSAYKGYIQIKRHKSTILVHKNEMKKLKLILDMGKGARMNK